MKLMTMTLLILTLSVLTIPAAASDQNTTTVDFRSYNVSRVKLDDPMTATTADGKKMAVSEAYLVRLNGLFPAYGASLFEIYIGDERIEEFGSGPKGLYFMVLTEDHLKKLSGKEIRYRYRSKEIKPLGAIFDPSRFAPFSLVSMKDALQK